MPPSLAFVLLSPAVSETLRSVAATRSWFLPWVRSSTLASIGIVLLRSAMPCARRSPRRNSVFAGEHEVTLVANGPACDEHEVTVVASDPACDEHFSGLHAHGVMIAGPRRHRLLRGRVPPPGQS